MDKLLRSNKFLVAVVAVGFILILVMMLLATNGNIPNALILLGAIFLAFVVTIAMLNFLAMVVAFFYYMFKK